MKKNLAVRAGAVAMVLMLAFFSILPDLVNAEGDDAKPSEEVLAVADESEPEIVDGDMAQMPEVEAPDTNLGTSDTSEEPKTTGDDTSVDVPDEGNGDDTTATEEPSTEDPSGDASEPKEDLPPESETPAGVPDVENPSLTEPDDLQTPSEAVTPDETVVTDVAGVEDVSGEMDTIEDYMALLDEVSSLGDRVDSIKLRFAAGINLIELADLAESDEDDFIIEGGVLVGYQGDGGYITIPSKVTAIADSAFFGMTSITGVVFPAGLQSIGNSAFNSCSNLRAVGIPDTVTFVGASAFANCTALTEAVVGAGTGSISQNEFYNCISLQSVSVPEGISRIESGAFAGCGNLGSIALPSTLASLDMGAFSGDVNLASVSVASGSYSSYDGCVYTAGGGQLLLCPQGKTSISFAPGMQSVASGAFLGCNYLMSAVIPDAAGSIEANAFSGSSIKAVTIPTAVTSIGAQSGWAPNVVYGYKGSAAETWAHASNYVFESLDTPSNVGGIVNEEHIEDPDDYDPDDETGGTNTQIIYLGSSGTGNGTSATISRNGGSGTPKTGVADYGSYFLFGSIFLAGIALVAYSRKLRLEKK